MANTKVSALPELAAFPASDDELLVLDTSAAATTRTKHVTHSNFHAIPYAEIYDTTDQTPANTDVTEITLDQAGTVRLIAHSAGASSVTVQRAGVYLVVLDCHVGRTSGGGTDYIDVWLELNGSAMALTRTRRVLRTSGALDELHVRKFAALAANDVIKGLMQVSTSGNGIGLKGLAASGSVPAVPSAMLELVWVGES